MNNQKEKQQKPAMASEHLLVVIKITIPVLPSMGSYTNDNTRLCVNDDCFDLLAFANRNYSQKIV